MVLGSNLHSHIDKKWFLSRRITQFSMIIWFGIVSLPRSTWNQCSCETKKRDFGKNVEVLWLPMGGRGGLEANLDKRNLQFPPCFWLKMVISYLKHWQKSMLVKRYKQLYNYIYQYSNTCLNGRQKRIDIFKSSSPF